MAVVPGRDRLGRLYWYDAATGRRARQPLEADRPRYYRVDTLGRGYWTWGDTGRRAPKPEWDAAPRYDSAGRPRDSSGRMVPRAALTAPTTSPKPPRPAPKKRKKKPTKGPRVKARPPRRVRIQVRGPSDTIPGFSTPRPPYVTRPTETVPRKLDQVFQRWLLGAVRKSPVASASEIGFRQYGVVFSVRSRMDTRDLAELTDLLAGQHMRLVFRYTAPSEMEIWCHLNLPVRRTGLYQQAAFQQVRAAFIRAEHALATIYDFLDGEQADFTWHMYFETEDIMYE